MTTRLTAHWQSLIGARRKFSCGTLHCSELLCAAVLLKLRSREQSINVSYTKKSFHGHNLQLWLFCGQLAPPISCICHDWTYADWSFSIETSEKGSDTGYARFFFLFLFLEVNRTDYNLFYSLFAFFFSNNQLPCGAIHPWVIYLLSSR